MPYRDLRGLSVRKGIIPLLIGRKAVGIARSHMIQITEISPLHAGVGFYLSDTLTLVGL